jgi:hypothetical protein
MRFMVIAMCAEIAITLVGVAGKRTPLKMANAHHARHGGNLK